MHELRLFQMLVRRDGTVVTDYDFRLGKNHLRGTGWRGLIALMMILIFVTTTVGILVIPATPASVLLFRFLSRLLGA